MAKKKQRFEIDFFEFSFLVAACIPPRPIARTVFFQNVIDKYYHELTKDERARLYEWICREHSFDTENELCQIFISRYNPENQYLVEDIKGEKHELFLHKGEYRMSVSSWLPKEHIKEVFKLS